MQVVPLQPIANQTLQVQLNGQACTLNVFQFAYGLFVSIFLGNQLIKASVIGNYGTRLVLDAYLGFSGDLLFVDTQGSENPLYYGLGARWQLVYLAPADLSALGLS